jgi:hypothetical protein
MKKSLFFASLMIAGILAMALSGCSKPPEAERSAAKTAMDAALTAYADKYASADFSAAQKLWVAAEDQVRAKKYEEAKQGYIDTKAAFEKSLGGIEEGKKAFVGQANAAIAELEEGWKGLEAAFKKVEGRMEKKEMWETDANSFREGLKAAHEMVAKDPAGVIAKADQLKRFLGAYGAIFKKMAAAPAKKQPTRKKDRGD